MIAGNGDEANETVQNFQARFGAGRRDVALSIVQNERSDDPQAVPPVQPSIAGPLIHREGVLWGLPMINQKPKGHTFGDIPYYNLRRRASINPGTHELERILGSSVETVWHKMGDNDLPFHDPVNADDRQMQILRDKAAGAAPMATFGYNLVTTLEPKVGSQVKRAAIADLVSMVYQFEAMYREELKGEGYDLYPAEPSTYYYQKGGDYIWKPNAEGSGDEQMKEGLALKHSIFQGRDRETTRHDFHAELDALETTGAGDRNGELIDYLQSVISPAGRFRRTTRDDFITNASYWITRMKQSYFNPATHRGDLRAQEAFRARAGQFLRPHLVAMFNGRATQ